MGFRRLGFLMAADYLRFASPIKKGRPCGAALGDPKVQTSYLWLDSMNFATLSRSDFAEPSFAYTMCPEGYQA